MSETQFKLAQALALYQQRRVPEAVALYREVLMVEPRNVDALHLCGLALASLGDFQRSPILLDAAAQIAPGSAMIQANLAAALSGAGRAEEALAAYERALAIEPQLPAAVRGRAMALMHLNRHEEAVAGFREALRIAPNDDHAGNGLGVVLEQMGRADEAREQFARALLLNPANAEAHHNLGLLEATAGRHAEALASIERALALQPRQPILHLNHGVQLLALRRPEEAVRSFDRALALQPRDALTHHNRGLALFALGRHEESLASFDRALEAAPDHAARQLWRGKTLLELGRPAEALAAFEIARQCAPGEFEVHMHCGGALTLLERHEESLASFDRALALEANSPEAANNRGAVLVRLFRPSEALEEFARALALRPDFADALINTGNVLRGLGRFDEAHLPLQRARELRPQDANVRWSQALLSLSQGDFRTGLPLYEARLELPPASQLQHPDVPRWNGAGSIAGRRLYVYADQGLGDTLQFCRYIPVLEGLGAQVIFAVQPVLVQLLQSLPMRGQLIARGEPAPGAELSVPLASVPLALGTEIATIPGGVPYLRAEPKSAITWAGRLAALPGVKVGLNWHGNPAAEKFAALQARSFPLAAAAPLAQVKGVSLVSLQKGDGAQQRERVSFADALAQLTEPSHMGAAELATETAALIEGLDLVITADTALAHLAGALGVPVWVMLQHIPDWRWLTDRSDSPWYPTMRLFRQSAAGNWDELFERVASELSALVRARA